MSIKSVDPLIAQNYNYDPEAETESDEEQEKVKSLQTLAFEKLEFLRLDKLIKRCEDEEKMDWLVDFLGKEGKTLAEKPDSFIARKLMSLLEEVKVKGHPLRREEEHQAVLKPILLTQEKDFISRYVWDPKKRVQNGYGEFIVYSKSKEITRDIFLKAYRFFCSYTPGNIAKQFAGSQRKSTDCYKFRHLSILNEVKKIDHDLEIAFVPRTLYELVFIQKCIREDVKRGKDCKLGNWQNEERAPLKTDPKCWHLVDPFKHASTFNDMFEPYVVDIAYRMNRTLAKRFLKMPDDSYESLARETHSQVQFLMNYFKLGPGCAIPEMGPAREFAIEAADDGSRSMGIRNEADASILRKMVALECSYVAQSCIFLSRGASLEDDSPDFCGEGDCFSLSFGTSLFAGVVYDTGASAYHYIRGDLANKEPCDGYTIALPVHQFYTSVFHVPPVNAIPQLYGLFEDWHARTKLWKGVDKKNTVFGIRENSYSIEHLKSNFSREEMVKMFEELKLNPIIWNRK